MKVMVTGGSGYFGSLLIKQLLKEGQRYSIDLNPPDENKDDISFFKADIRDIDMLKNCLHGIEIIYHNVAQVHLLKIIGYLGKLIF